MQQAAGESGAPVGGQRGADIGEAHAEPGDRREVPQPVADPLREDLVGVVAGLHADQVDRRRGDLVDGPDKPAELTVGKLAVVRSTYSAIVKSGPPPESCNTNTSGTGRPCPRSRLLSSKSCRSCKRVSSWVSLPLFKNRECGTRTATGPSAADSPR